MASEICMMCRPFLRTTGFHPDCMWHGTRAKERNTRPAPAATDTGLVTVAYQYKIPRNGHWDNLPSDWTADECKAYDKQETRELVTRSQAVELLAGRDTVIEMQADSIDKLERKVQHWQEEVEAVSGHLDCEPDSDSILHTVREIEADKSIYKERAEQADELLAAKDKTIALAETTMIEMHQDLNKLEADNAAKDARIKALEADRDHQSKLSNKLNRSHAALEAKLAAAEKALETKSAANEALSKSVVESIDTEKRLREALELIADIDTRPYRCASIARAALGGKPS